MAIQFPSNIQLNLEKPLDTRYVVVDEAARLALKYVYDGLIVYEADTKRLYVAKVTDGTTSWSLIQQGGEDVLEGVQINGTDLPIVDKKVNIEIADADTLGVVKSASSENQVAVESDGSMTVNSLNVTKLVQTAGDIFILNGGNASNP